jgi:hypothetical protein
LTHSRFEKSPFERIVHEKCSKTHSANKITLLSSKFKDLLWKKTTISLRQRTTEILQQYGRETRNRHFRKSQEYGSW